MILTLLALVIVPSSNLHTMDEYKDYIIGGGFAVIGLIAGKVWGNYSTSTHYEKQMVETSHERIAKLAAVCDSTEKSQSTLLQLSNVKSVDALAQLVHIIENDEQRLINFCNQIASIQKEKEQVDMQILRWKVNKTVSPEEIAVASMKSERAEQLLLKAEKTQKQYYMIKPFAHAKLVYSNLNTKYAESLKVVTNKEYANSHKILLQQMINNPEHFEKLPDDIAQLKKSTQQLQNDGLPLINEAGYRVNEFDQLAQTLSAIEQLYKNAKPYIAMQVTMNDITRGASVIYNELLNVFKNKIIKHQFDINPANRQALIEDLINIASRHGKPYLYILKFVDSLSGNIEIIDHQLKTLKADISREINPSFVAKCEQELEILKTTKSVIMQTDEYKKFCDLRDKEIKREQKLKQEKFHQKEMERLQQRILEEEAAKRQAEEEKKRELREQNHIERQKVKAIERQNALAAQQVTIDFANWASGTTKEDFERIKLEAREYKKQSSEYKAEISRLTQLIREISDNHESDSATVQRLKLQLKEATEAFNKTNNLLENKKQQALDLRNSLIEEMKGLSNESEEYEKLNQIVSYLTGMAY